MLHVKRAFVTTGSKHYRHNRDAGRNWVADRYWICFISSDCLSTDCRLQ